MIIKSYELQKIKIENFNSFLIHGKNQGLTNDIVEKNLKPKLSNNIYFYEEAEILKNSDQFKETIINKSFFENNKLIILRRASDKIFKIIQDILSLNSTENQIIILSNTLEKKSKLRNLFEKDNQLISIAIYEDNNQTLNQIAIEFFKKNKIKISQENINLITERCNGDRINLQNELLKIENFSLNKKDVSTEDLIKLTNLAENFDYTYLVNNSLAKNKRKTLNILNENNFVNEDCVMILRIYLNKLKRLLKIFAETKNNDTHEKIISSFKPPIFWKEKDFIKKQIKILSQSKIQDLINKVNNVEFLIKKNPSISVSLVTNFILEQLSETNNLT